MMILYENIKKKIAALELSIAARMMSRLSRGTPVSASHSVDVLKTLSPFFSQLVSVHGETMAPYLQTMLLNICHSIATGRANISDARLQSLFLMCSQFTSLESHELEKELRRWLRSEFETLFPHDARALIPALEKRNVPVMNTWVYQNTVMQWDISPDALVLDIGSGGWPFKRANHLADKYPDKTTHRVESMVRDERPFFEVDLEHLPFEDKKYDFVFCSHVLEHMDNPGKALRELMRVGKRGYIEVPTRLSDVMFNFTRLPDHHRWHGIILDKTLLLAEWNDWERRDLGNYFFDALQSDYSNQFQDFFERNRDLFYVSLTWADTIKFLIIDKHGKVIDSSES